jgi:glycosyltransferase involved in cell wall biosynthesis/GT2 family glycosyltransferase
VTPVYNTPEAVLDEALASVVGQSYDAWELIVVDDGGTQDHVRPLLHRWASIDARIRVVERAENGNISVATNTGVEASSGEFLVLLDHDDVLHPDCLAHLAIAIDREPDADVLYSDHDKIDETGRPYAPEFKPDWSPELLLSYCYAGHAKAIRTSLYRALGGQRVGFEGSQDHDLLLRASERARRVVHVPQLLYHWRSIPGSTAAGGREKPASLEAGRRAVEDAFRRRGVDCNVVVAPWAERDGSAIFRPEMPADGPSIAVLIAEADPASTSRLVAVLEASTYRNLRIETLGADALGRAALWNEAAARASEDLLLFVDGRVETRDPSLLKQLAGWARLEGVGAVGPRVLGRQGTIDHAGLTIDPERGVARKAFDGLPTWDPGYLNLARVARNASAISARCLLTRRDRFLALGGFDADAFPDDLFDVDYGLRLRAQGLRCVVAAECEVVAEDDRGPGDASPREIANLRECHPNLAEAYVSPHVEPASADLRIRPTVVPAGAAGRRLRLLAATHNLNWEGAPLIQYELMAALAASGRASAVVVSPADGPLRARYEEAGIEVEVMPGLADAADSVDRLSSGVRLLADRLAEGGFDALHANTLQAFWAVQAAGRAGVPSIWSVHESEPWKAYFGDFPPMVARSALEALAVPYRVVFASRGSMDLWKALDARSTFARIPTPLDVDRFRDRFGSLDRAETRRALGIDDDQICLLALGTVCERKGQHDLIEAFRRLPADAAGRACCVVVGLREGVAYGLELERRAAALPADRRGRFRIVAETGDTARYWLAADVFCCTSRVESYPRVVLEAMACSLPLVTTPVFGIAEQVRDGGNALFYPPGDHEALAAKLADLIRDDGLRRELAAQSPWVLRSLPDHRWFVDQYDALFRAAAESFAEPASDEAGVAKVHRLTPARA